VAAPQLGSDGLGDLKLGMTKAQAIATGLTTNIVGSDGGCGSADDGYLKAAATDPHGTPDLAGWLVFSHTSNRLVAIYAYPGVKTPAGIGLGSDYDDLHQAYPSWQPIGADQVNGRGGVTIPANPNAHYRIVVAQHKVVQLSLDGQQDCYE